MPLLSLIFIGALLIIGCIFIFFIQKYLASNKSGFARDSYEGLVEKLSDTTFCISSDGIIQCISPQIEKLCGYSIPELKGKNFNEYISESDLNIVSKLRRKALSAGIDRADFRIKSKSGENIFVRVSLKSVKGEGQKIFYRGILRDLESIKKAEDAAKIQEEKFYLLFENLPDVTVYHKASVDINGNINDFEIVDINTAFEDLTSLQRKDIIGRKMTEVMPLIERNPEFWLSVYTEVVEKGIRRKFEYFSSSLEMWFNISAFRTSPGYFVSILEDITEKKNSDIELMKTKSRLQYLVSESPAVIYTFSIINTPQINFVSDNIKNVLGYNPDYFLYSFEKWMECIHEDDRDKTDIMLKQLMNNKKYVSEYRFKDSDGYYRWIHDEQAVMTETDNGSVVIIGSFIDITELKRSEEKFSSIFHSNASIMVISNIITGEFLDVNDEFMETLNYRREDVIGKTAAEIGIFPNRSMRADIVEEIGRNGRVRNMNIEAYKKDREMVFGLLSADILVEPDEPLLLTMVVDITEQKKMERALIKSEERYRDLVQNANSIIVRLNPQGRIIFFNEFAQHFFGYTEEEIIGRNILSTIVPKENNELICIVKEIISSPEKYRNHENRNVKKNGEEVWVVWNNRVVYDENGNVKEILSVGSDITDRKIAEEKLIHAKQEADEAREKAQKATMAKSEFLAAMSHEIRTPMNSIVGMTNLALMTDDDDEKFEYLTTVRLSADHLMSVINDILDFSKIEAGRMVLDEHDFDLNNQVAVILSSFKHKADEKNLEFKYTIDPDIPPVVIADSAKIRQILINLISNSLKFTEKGHVHVKLEKIDFNDFPDFERNENIFLVRFSVEDTGIGINEDRIEDIFKSFTQAENSISRKYGGTGLGLTITRKLVNLMGGEIHVESKFGEGTLFYFVLPLVRGIENEIKKQDEDNDEFQIRHNSSHVKILLAEDNPVNQMLAKVILKKLGYEFDVAWNGVEVLEKLKKDKFDVVLMDLEMPGMGGIEATEKIRRGEAGEKNMDITILAMTAHVLNEYKEIAFKSGMNGFIDKPIDFNELICALQKINVN